MAQKEQLLGSARTTDTQHSQSLCRLATNGHLRECVWPVVRALLRIVYIKVQWEGSVKLQII